MRSYASEATHICGVGSFPHSCITKMASLVTDLCNSLFFFQALKYKSTRTNKRIILLLVAGMVLTVIVIVGAILLIPGRLRGYRDQGCGTDGRGIPGVVYWFTGFL